MRLSAETEDVHKALVAELAYTISPTTVMGLTLIVIGTFAFATLQDMVLAVATICGGLASVAKVVVMIRHRRFNVIARATRNQARRWEMVHGLLTWLVAASVGAIATAIFSYSDLSLQMLATALLFGYCAGVASRISVRPVISATAISIAAIPTIFSVLAVGDTAHRVLACMFAVFLVAAIQSVWHVYQTALRQIRMRMTMERQARRDPLTDLANRTALREAFSEIPRLEDTLVSIHCFDFDGFKAVNDRLGHSAGDELLAEVGDRLRHAIGHSDCAARMGGDEFAVLQTNVRQAVEADLLARKIYSALTEPYEIGNETVMINVSLGYTIASAEAADLDVMARLADAASYRAKRSGGGIDRQVAPHYE